MENIKLDPRWENLFNSNFPQTPIPDTLNVLPVVSDVAESLATSPTPASPSGGNYRYLVDSILLTGVLFIAFYGGYRWHKHIQEKKYKQV
jgi:hypothetical protein